ncbi:MAG TPA: glycosyltransferase family 4 protein [Bacteroidia bacterium]|jgi:glycosyltransferase involved in cell wall biosynthesis|nr:glycosyltransferase family 4 protein [Bacteroidia bacterium]
MSRKGTERLRIAYITPTDARNKHSWSGTDYYIWKTLQKHVGDIELMRPQEPALLVFLLKIFHGISLFVFKKRFDWRHSNLLSKAYARSIQKKLKNNSFDLIVAPAADAVIAYLETTIPIIYINDRTIVGSLEYHRMLTNLWEFSKKQSMLVDKQAIEKSLFTSYPSEWAAQSAVQEYGIATEKIVTIPFGANMDEAPDRSIALQRKKGGTCKLLFIGVNWRDKGGSIAYDCLLELLKLGIDAELTVVGCVPPTVFKHEKLTVIPFLNKNSTEDVAQLQSLWTHSTFLILPTRIDAFGIVFCEAAAYGLPCIGTNTGGVAGALHENKNGYLMPFSAGGKEYAARIAATLKDDAAYQSLVISARDEFEKELNWDSWALTIKTIFQEKNRKNQ